MDLAYLQQRRVDELSRAFAAASAPARLAHERLAAAYAERIQSEEEGDESALAR